MTLYFSNQFFGTRASLFYPVGHADSIANVSG
jgi:hypothetical protein